MDAVPIHQVGLFVSVLTPTLTLGHWHWDTDTGTLTLGHWHQEYLWPPTPLAHWSQPIQFSFRLIVLYSTKKIIFVKNACWQCPTDWLGPRFPHSKSTTHCTGRCLTEVKGVSLASTCPLATTIKWAWPGHPSKSSQTAERIFTQPGEKNIFPYGWKMTFWCPPTALESSENVAFHFLFARQTQYCPWPVCCIFNLPFSRIFGH